MKKIYLIFSLIFLISAIYSLNISDLDNQLSKLIEKQKYKNLFLPFKAIKSYPKIDNFYGKTTNNDVLCSFYNIAEERNEYFNFDGCNIYPLNDYYDFLNSDDFKFYNGKKNSFLVGENGFSTIKGKKLEYYKYPIDLEFNQFIQSKISIYDSLLFITHKNNLFCYNGKKIHHAKNLQSSIYYNDNQSWINDIISNNNRLYFTDANNIYFWNTKKITKFFQKSDEQDNKLLSVDNENNLWFVEYSKIQFLNDHDSCNSKKVRLFFFEANNNKIFNIDIEIQDLNKLQILNNKDKTLIQTDNTIFEWKDNKLLQIRDYNKNNKLQVISDSHSNWIIKYNENKKDVLIDHLESDQKIIIRNIIYEKNNSSFTVEKYNDFFIIKTNIMMIVFNSITNKYKIFKFPKARISSSKNNLVLCNITTNEIYYIYPDLKYKKVVFPFEEKIVQIEEINDKNFIINGLYKGFYLFRPLFFEIINENDGLLSNNIKTLVKIDSNLFNIGFADTEYNQLLNNDKLQTHYPNTNITFTEIIKNQNAKNSKVLIRDNYIYKFIDNKWEKVHHYLRETNKKAIVNDKDFKLNNIIVDNSDDLWILDKKIFQSPKNSLNTEISYLNKYIKKQPLQILDLISSNNRLEYLISTYNRSLQFYDTYYFREDNSYIYFQNKLLIEIFDTDINTYYTFIDQFGNYGTYHIVLNEFMKIVDNLEPFAKVYFENEKKYDRFWLSTTDNQLISIQNETNKLKVKEYFLQDGIAQGELTGAAESSSGDLWFSFRNGISKYIPQQDQFISYSFNDGIPYTNINDIEIQNGTILLATELGLIKFSEIDYSANPTVDCLLINNQIIPTNSDMINIKDKSFTVLIKMNDYPFPEQAKYSYFLEGHFDKWSEFKNKQQIVFNNIPSGKYKLKIKCKLKNNTIVDMKPLNIYVKNKWYESKIFYGFIIIFLLAGIYSIYNYFRIKQLQKQQNILEMEVQDRTKDLSFANVKLEQKNRQLDAEKTKLTDSIQYASLIQNSILPRKAELSQYIKDFFIIWKPRDIVGGDFYWFYPIPHNVTPSKVEEVNNTKEYLISVIDCTGHGVPGAFMSMTANSILNNIVREKQIYEPDKILNLLHKEIRYTLRQQAKESQQDGMDISLCLIKPKEIHFAGAMQSAYFVRGDRSGEIGDREIRRIRGDRFSIGGKQKEAERIFRKQIIKYNPGDKIYLMSDGLADQKVKIDGKEQRFKTKRVQKLLNEIADLPMKEQKEKIAAELVKLQGDFEQRDDIIVMGVEL